MPAVTRPRLAILLFLAALIVLTTWPVFQRVLDLETFWLLDAGNDIWLELWEVWYGSLLFTGQADLYQTDLLFYPQGASLAYHQFSLPHMLVVNALQLVLPLSSAFSLGYLLTLFANAIATYVCLEYATKDRWASLFGAVLVGLCPLLARSMPAEVTTFATVPLTITFLQRAVRDGRPLHAALCGATLGLTAYVGLYLFLCLLITLAIYGLYLAWARWRELRFWSLAALALFAFAIAGTPRLAPLLGSQSHVDDVLDYRPYWRSHSNDLLDSFTHPLLSERDVFGAYLGYVPLLLIACGLLRGGRRRMLPWLAILLVFLVLRLGTHFTFAGVEYPELLLPKHYLNYLFPALFRGVAGGRHWQFGALLPLAMLSGYGMLCLWRTVGPARRPLVALALIALLAIEYYRQPLRGSPFEQEQVAFLDWLEADETTPVRLINLPMSVDFERYYYNFLQSLSGYPQVEGSVNRVLPEAYAYINDNLLLRTWKRGRAIHCLPANRAAFEADARRLLDDGFTHIVFHGGRRRPEWHSFTGLAPAYRDEHATIFRVQDLSQSCDNAALRSYRLAPLQSLALAPDIVPDPDIALLSQSPGQPIDPDAFAYFASLFADWGALIQAYARDGELALQSADGRYAQLEAIASDFQLVLILQGAQAAPQALQPLEAWIAGEYQVCDAHISEGGLSARLAIAPGYPCQLFAPASRVDARYANGIELAGFHHERAGDKLNLSFHWRNRPGGDATHSFSVQLFDAAGARALHSDQVLGHAPLSWIQFDLTGLAPGEYALRLVVYHFHTGASVAGVVGEAAFERDFELRRVTLD